eukprot:PITA_35027
MSASSFPQTNSEIEMEIQRSSPATTAESSFASSSNATDPMVYDVFINHRGPDTKATFASPLYRRLLSHGFRAFLDEQELEAGIDFPSQIVHVIGAASVHVAVFSPRYTESAWCLNELLLMRESGNPIIPVFYKVSPAELRYGNPLHALEMKTNPDPETGMPRPRYDSATIKNWRNALSIVADISGFDLEGKFHGEEIRMLDELVESVLKRVKKTKWYVAKYPTGLDEKVEDFEREVLKQPQHSRKVQVLGIVAMGGMGKTTLAVEFFNRKNSDYNKSYCLLDVRENARKSSLHSLQSKVLKGLTQQDVNIENTHQGTEILKRYLRDCHVLLILDDVDHEDQLDAFLPVKDLLRFDSLVLITSRDREVLRKSGVEESSIYKLKGLSTKHSRELFCSYAFCKPYPLQGFEALVNDFIEACQGLPLSLKVFGALFLGRNDNKSFWRDTLSLVHQQLPNDIKKQLKISYDALNKKEQQMFLDIACFFIGEKRDMTMGIWDDTYWKGSLGFQNLESKCLVDVDSANCIHMHDQLRDLGRDIARDELPHRFSDPAENIRDLLQQPSGITEVRGIRIFVNNDMDSWRQMIGALFGNCVMELYNRLQNTRYRSLGIGITHLQLIQTRGHLLGHILRRAHSPNLLWLSWYDCPYSYLPSWIPLKNLRVLKVYGTVFKALWQGRSQAPIQLRELEIFGKLSKIPKSIGQLIHLEQIFFSYVSFQKLPEEFCQMRCLRVLGFERCYNLKALPDSFGNLTNLEHIELSGCSSLQRLPESFGNLKNLSGMVLSKSLSLERLPESLGNLTNLQSMVLSKSLSLERLPESLGNLTNLQSMELSWCRRLERLPESLGNLTNLQSMELSGCVRLERLPESLGNLTNLQSMVLSKSLSLERLPESLGNLTNLQSMVLSKSLSLERLPESLGNLTNLKSLNLCNCTNLKRLPESLGNLTNLQRMELSHPSMLERLPESLGNLTNLQSMELSWCIRLVRLPESLVNLTNLEILKLCNVSSLKKLPESLGNLTNLEFLKLSQCESLERLPESLGNLTNLQSMELSGCIRLERLPESLVNLTNLEILKLCNVSSLKRLPESLGNLTNLEILKLCDGKSLKRLPESLGNLTNLQSMELSGCIWVERLPESLGNLTNLEILKLCYGVRLKRLPESLGNLTNLKEMDLKLCQSLESLPPMKALVSLKWLTLSGCTTLKSIPDLAHLTRLESLRVDGCFGLEELDAVEQCMSLMYLYLPHRLPHRPRPLLSEGVLKKLQQRLRLLSM